MAYVDFSNAHIECINRQVFATSGCYLCLYDQAAGQRFRITKSGTDATSIASISGHYVGNFTKEGFSVYMTGTFNSSGNSFGLFCTRGVANDANGIIGYLVTDIEFEAGDIFSCQININFSYN